MARPKKNGVYLNVCIEKNIYEELEIFCEDAGQTKTIAVERALVDYMLNYQKKKAMIKSLEGINEG